MACLRNKGVSTFFLKKVLTRFLLLPVGQTQLPGFLNYS